MCGLLLRWRCVVTCLLVAGVSFADDPRVTRHQFDGGPSRVDLREYLPTPRKQSKNDCVAWAIAYVSYSCQICQERQTTRPTRACDLFSPAFVYNELAGQHDDGLHLNDAINFVNEHGCATLQTMPLTPDDEASDSGAEREARIYRPWGHKRVTSLAQIRRHVRNGFPVILVIRNDQVFNRSAALSEAFQWQKTKAEMDADFDKYGPHAICAVGYDDAKQAVLVVNSLGTDWKDGGYCWVHYNNLATIPTVRTDESETWCLEAHVIQVKEELPASVLMKHRLANVRFKLDQQHKVFNDTRRLSPITWKIQDIACNDHTVFLLRDDHLVARLNKIVDVLEDDADAVWTHLTHGLPANSEVTMIAATTGTSVHALTRGGELFNFDSDSGKWKQVTIPNSENAAVIDLRDGRSHGPLSVTTIRGRVFEFDLDEGWLEK